MQQKKHRFFYGYYILACCFLFFVASGTLGYGMSLFVKPLTDEFGWKRAEIMGGSTLNFLVSGLVAPFIGRVVPRIGAKRIIALGALGMGCSLALWSLTQNLWQYYLFAFMAGIFGGGMGILPISMVVSNWFHQRRGWAIGVLGSGIGVGGFVMPQIIGNIFIPNFGWRGAYLLCGLLIVVMIIPLDLLVIKTKPEDMGLYPDGADTPPGEVAHVGHSRKKVRDEVEMNFNEARKTSAFWLMALAFGTFSVANASIMQNHAPHLQGIGFNLALAATAVSFVGVGSAIGKFSFGWLCDYVPAKFSFAIGIGCEALGVLILMNINPLSPGYWIWAYALIFGLGVGCWLPSMSMTISSTFGIRSYGVIFGVISLIWSIGGSLGPVTAGFIYDNTGNYFWAFVVALVMYLIAVPVMMFVRSSKGDVQKESKAIGEKA
jgi:MFS family permease